MEAPKFILSQAETIDLPVRAPTDLSAEEEPLRG